MGTMQTYLTAKGVMDRLKINRTILRQLVNHRAFPKPVYLENGTLRWEEAAVNAWLKRQPKSQCIVRRRHHVFLPLH